MSDQQFTGECLCGSIKFQVTADKLGLYQCHCSLCRRVSGSSSNSATLVDANKFKWLEGDDKVTFYQTPDGFRSDFCSQCGCPMPNSINDGKGYWIPVGLLNESENIEIKAHVFTASHASWHSIAGSAPKFREMPVETPLINMLDDEGPVDGQFVVRRFQEPDRQSIKKLWQDCGLTVSWNDPDKDINRKVDRENDLFLVGLLREKTVASVMGGYDGHRGWINYLAVHPDHQGLGLGRALMQSVEDRIKALGCPKINLQIRNNNQTVIDFYEAIGYRQDAVVSYGKRLEPDE